MTHLAPILIRLPAESLSAYVSRLEHEVHELPQLEQAKQQLLQEIEQQQFSLHNLTARLAQGQAARERLAHLSELLESEMPTPPSADAPSQPPSEVEPPPPEAAQPAPDVLRALPKMSVGDTYSQRIESWLRSAPQLREYSPKEIAEATAVPHGRVSKALRPLMQQGLVDRIERPLFYPTYAPPRYKQVRADLVNALARCEDAQNLAAVMELISPPLAAKDAQHLVQLLAEDGLIFAFSDIDDATEEQWFSTVRPDHDVIWIIPPPSL